MLEDIYTNPQTLDRIRASWIADPIEQYISWLTERNYSKSSKCRRVSVLCRFGEYAADKGANKWSDLPAHVETFIDYWVKVRGWQSLGKKTSLNDFKKTLRNPIQQMLKIIVPEFQGLERKSRIQPYRYEHIDDFFRYLKEERGLSANTIKLYHHCIRKLDQYLVEIGITDLNQVNAPLVSAFLTKASPSVGKGQLGCICSALKVLLRYLYRERIIDRDLSLAVEGPQRYRLSDIPRSISWDEVRQMLEAVDRRSTVGKRDYAILLLLVTYGLRAREIAALTLDDLDWKQERLYVPERKAGHSAAFPLTPIVGNAVIEYIKFGRPQTKERNIFFRAMAPQEPMTFNAVAHRASYYLKLAGVQIARPGSHTLRHSCVRRLLEANIPLKVIGDYLGHRSPDSTKIYAKIDIERMREVALGDGENIV